ncbi:MAG: PadR family transcriptional regulator [Nitrososphaerales archaeon]
MSKRKKASFDFHGAESTMRPQGAPRGLLFYYILHSISSRPTHGYEILQDIDSKTEGAWRPGPGSIYPMLKKLVSEGLIKSDSKKGTQTAQRIYHITTKGEKRLRETQEMFASAGKKWGSMRRIFVEILDPKDLGTFFVDGTKLNFQIAQETFESKVALLAPTEAQFILREYALNLEKQLNWCNSLLDRKTLQIMGEVKGR